MSSKVSRAPCLLKHANNFTFLAFARLYTGILEPYFWYYCSVWGSAGTANIYRLQKLNNRTAKIATNSSFDTPNNLLIVKLGWKTVLELIDIESKSMVFTSVHELAHQYLCNFLGESRNVSHNMRNTSTDLRLPKRSTTTVQKCFFYISRFLQG